MKLSEGDYKLSFRRGYYADKPETRPASEAADGDPLIPLVRFGMPNFDQITYKIQAAPVVPQPEPSTRRAGLNTELKGPFTRYGVDLDVALQSFELDTAADGAKHGRIEIMLVAYDRNGNIANISKLTSRFVLPPKDYLDLQTKGFPLHLEIDVPRGDVYLRTGVYDLSSGKAGTLGFPLAGDHRAPDGAK